MRMYDLIEKKKHGESLSAEEIHWMVSGYVEGSIPDYQMSAMLMAIWFQGMNDQEITELTLEMAHSGDTADLSPIAGIKVDKHSTGGVGDKLSLVIQPLAAACGVYVPSLTGRGLGITGGTADKLETIPGYNASLSLDDFEKVVKGTGVSMTVQTDEITPADKKLYALRDVTGTVASIPLITASILSKKLAEGAGTLVFDVKCGSGAFMKTREDAAALARSLVDGAKAAGRRAAALVTDMSAPLGLAVGNANEVAEALAWLGSDRVGLESFRPAPNPTLSDPISLSVELAALMVSLTKEIPLEDARQMCRGKLADGSALAVVLNYSAAARRDYGFRLADGERAEIILSSDRFEFGGKNELIEGELADHGGCTLFDVPPFTALIIRLTKTDIPNEGDNNEK